jgi:hypothetical protein
MIDKLLDAGQYGLLIAFEDPVIAAIKLDESCIRDMIGEMPASADANGAVATTVEHQQEEPAIRLMTIRVLYTMPLRRYERQHFSWWSLRSPRNRTATGKHI